MNLLVAGSEQVDAGKTTFSTGLLERTGAIGYKPRAGNDYWYSHPVVQAAADDGVLYGKDARRLATAGPDTVRPVDINAIHRLWQPKPGGTGRILGQDGREFLLDRIGETYVRNGTIDLPDPVRASFPVETAASVESLAEFNDVMETHHRPAQTTLAEEIDVKALTVVESYSDIASPLRQLDHDAVAVVEPRRARIFDGERYDKACSIAGGSPGPDHGTLEQRVADVTDLIEPVTAVELPPLGETDRTDPVAIAEAYDDAYDAVLRTAGAR